MHSVLALVALSQCENRWHRAYLVGLCVLSSLSLLAFLLTLALERLLRLHRVVLKLYLNLPADLESFLFKAVFDSEDDRHQGFSRRLALLEK